MYIIHHHPLIDRFHRRRRRRDLDTSYNRLIMMIDDTKSIVPSYR